MLSISILIRHLFVLVWCYLALWVVPVSWHISLWLPTYADVDEEYERLLKLGLKFPSGEPITYSFGIRNFYVADPEGNLIEIGSMNK